MAVSSAKLRVRVVVSIFASVLPLLVSTDAFQHVSAQLAKQTCAIVFTRFIGHAAEAEGEKDGFAVEKVSASCRAGMS